MFINIFFYGHDSRFLLPLVHNYLGHDMIDKQRTHIHPDIQNMKKGSSRQRRKRVRFIEPKVATYDTDDPPTKIDRQGSSDTSKHIISRLTELVT